MTKTQEMLWSKQLWLRMISGGNSAAVLLQKWIFKSTITFSFRICFFFLLVASLPTAPSGLAPRRCSTSIPVQLFWCFWLLTHLQFLFFTHFLSLVGRLCALQPLLPALRAPWAVISGAAAEFWAAGTSQAPHSRSFQGMTRQSHCPGPQQEESPAQPFSETQKCPQSHRVTQSEPITPETPALIKPVCSSPNSL